ncbi:uncharacterized protein LOC131207926 [Anopheles bellator]|uniref:uncharacterized protein LOC131207926 n=1 Tax=Anopheles bellator TaxID=139047 RepID=UPI002647C0F7|nr:uncharacterized protein LOC131207926 [Anopheles bellator]
MSNGNDGQEPGPSKRRRVPPPEYYNYYSDSDSDSETEFDAEKHQNVLEEYNTADDPEDYRRRMVELSCRVTLIAERSPDTRNELLCALGSFIPGLSTDPRTLLEGPWDITPTDVPGLAEPAAFWQRDVEEAIRAQTSSSTVGLDLFIAGAPFMHLNNPKLTSWVVLGRVREATKPPGEPFVLSVFSGSEAPTPHVLLSPLCDQLPELPNVTRRPGKTHIMDAKSASFRAKW